MLQDQFQDKILVDKTKLGRARPWRDKKMKNELLAYAYDEVNPRKALRLRQCATALAFEVQPSGTKRLARADFCRVRLCPMCGWRRSLKIYDHIRRIMDAMPDGYAYIFVTLTVRTCTGAELGGTIDQMMAAWQRLMQRMPVQRAVKGWYRGLEVTHDTHEYITREMYRACRRYYDSLRLVAGDNNSNFDFYHPHFHCIFAVNKSYFTDKTYISHAKWVELWRKSMRLGYDPVVDVRRVHGTTAVAVAEVAKYTVKDSDYIVPDDWDLTVDTVRILDRALDHRRLVAYGGSMKELHKKLNLDDEVDGDFVDIGDEEKGKEEDKKVVTYAWNTGYSQYLQQSSQ